MEEPLKGSKSFQFNSENNEYSKSYLHSGSIHGLKYLGRKQKCEKIFFAFILLISVAFTSISIWFLSQSEVDVLNTLQPQPIHNLPFAAITICPETKVKKSFISFSEAYIKLNSGHNFSTEELVNLEALSQVCDSHLISKNLTEKPTFGRNFHEILRKIGPDSSELFCKFRNQLKVCSGFFQETVTDAGICSTFNMLPNDQMFSTGDSELSWSPKTGYKNSNIDDFPYRAFKGAFVGMNVVLSQNSTDLDYMCTGPVQGWRVKIHSPDEFPSMMNGFERISLNQETTIVVKPEVVHRSGSICHTSSSKPLKFFKEYSQENCMSECLSSFVLSRCGCVKFSMIHDNETPICSQHNTKCAAKAIDEYQTAFRFEEKFSCDCKPSCSHVKYNTKIYQAEFNFKRTFSDFQEDLKEFPKTVMSRLVVYMEDDFYTPIIYSSSKSSLVNMIAKIGGILGFFLGASWISIIEVGYYFIRRFSSQNK